MGGFPGGLLPIQDVVAREIQSPIGDPALCRRGDLESAGAVARHPRTGADGPTEVHAQGQNKSPGDRDLPPRSSWPAQSDPKKGTPRAYTAPSEPANQYPDPVGGVAMATTLLTWTPRPGKDPTKPASPKANTPPSEPTSQ